MQLITTIHSSNYLILNVDNIWQHLTILLKTINTLIFLVRQWKKKRSRHESPLKIREIEILARRMPASSAISWEEYGVLSYLGATWWDLGAQRWRQCTMRHATGIFLMSRFEISVVLSVWEILQIWLLGFLLLVVASIASSLQLRVSPCRGSLKQVG